MALPIPQLRQCQDIAALQLESGLSAKALLQALHQIAVQLHRLHRSHRAGQQLRR